MLRFFYEAQVTVMYVKFLGSIDFMELPLE